MQIELGSAEHQPFLKLQAVDMRFHLANQCDPDGKVRCPVTVLRKKGAYIPKNTEARYIPDIRDAPASGSLLQIEKV